MFPAGGDEAMQHIRSKDTGPVYSPCAGIKQILSVLPDTFPNTGMAIGTLRAESTTYSFLPRPPWRKPYHAKTFLLCMYRNFCRKSTIYKRKADNETSKKEKLFYSRSQLLMTEVMGS